MPPKLTKKELEEIARQEEEQKRLEEEARLKKEAEEKKKYEPEVLKTGLKCILTPYYFKTVLKHSDSRQFTEEFLRQYLQKNNLEQNYREDIDLPTLVEYNLHNINFAIQNQFNTEELYVLVNLLQTVYLNNSPRMVEFRAKKAEESEQDYEKSVKQHIKSQKVQKNEKSDLSLLQKLLENHSKDSENGQQIKYFTPKALQLIIEYMRETYFAHYSLYQYILYNDQQQQEINETVFIDEPQQIVSGLDNADYEPLDNKQDLDQQEQNQEQTQQIDEEQGKDEGEEEEEEELDPISLQIVQQKIREAQQEIDKTLEERGQELQQKLEDLAQPKKKK